MTTVNFTFFAYSQNLDTLKWFTSIEKNLVLVVTLVSESKLRSLVSGY